MSDEPAAPGAEEPDAPGTEEEPTPPGMEEAEAEEPAVTMEAASAAPEQAVPEGEPVAASAAAPATSAAYPYPYGQQQADGSYAYDQQYAGYDQYYAYYGYGNASGTNLTPLRHCSLFDSW